MTSFPFDGLTIWADIDDVKRHLDLSTLSRRSSWTRFNFFCQHTAFLAIKDYSTLTNKFGAMFVLFHWIQISQIWNQQKKVSLLKTQLIFGSSSKSSLFLISNIVWKKQNSSCFPFTCISNHFKNKLVETSNTQKITMANTQLRYYKVNNIKFCMRSYTTSFSSFLQIVV